MNGVEERACEKARQMTTTAINEFAQVLMNHAKEWERHSSTVTPTKFMTAVGRARKKAEESIAVACLTVEPEPDPTPTPRPDPYPESSSETPDDYMGVDD